MLDTLATLQARFAHERGVLTVNVYRHPGCGFQRRAGETRAGLIRAITAAVGHEPADLQVFADPEEDLRLDLDVLRGMRWLTGTTFTGYVREFESSEVRVVR